MQMIDARIPLWFYGITSVIYLLSSVICFLAVLYSYKAYKIDPKKKVIFLMFGFLLLGLGFVMLALPSLYIYFGFNYQGGLSINYVNYIGFSAYYFLSTAAYFLFLLMYIPKGFKSKNFVIFVPLWYASSVKFHSVSVGIISLVLIQTIINSLKKKNLDSYLVMFAFLSLAMFHLLLLLASFSVINFVLANSILILGFLSLLLMLIRVNYGGKEKV